MCSSYGLQAPYSDRSYHDIVDNSVLEQLRTWAVQNGGDTLRPTGRHRRNLNPMVTTNSTLELGWWGYLVDGRPATFPSTNTRSERFLTSTKPLPRRVIVPATHWFEMQKPSKRWFELGLEERQLLGLAAFARPGRTEDGTEYLCYSLVMRPALDHISHAHDRMPLLIAPELTDEWIHSDAAGTDLLATMLAASDDVGAGIAAQTRESPL